MVSLQKESISEKLVRRDSDELRKNGEQLKAIRLQKESEDKCRKVAQKIVDLTGYGQALHVNDILPDLRELLSNREKEIAEEVEKINNKANTGEYLQAKEHAKEHETALNTGAYEATNEVLQLLKH